MLVIEDTDVPLPRPIVHGLFGGIYPGTTELAEGALDLEVGTPDAAAPTGGTAEIDFGTGGFRRRSYAEPRPVPGHGRHRYTFQLVRWIDSPV
ncbi:hypothetical protein [Nocardia nova]|uniref:hypothetical protein n=1 Tax=Nocardia nova TaxID=37330 RepID=UPI0015E2FD44